MNKIYILWKWQSPSTWKHYPHFSLLLKDKVKSLSHILSVLYSILSIRVPIVPTVEWSACLCLFFFYLFSCVFFFTIKSAAQNVTVWVVCRHDCNCMFTNDLHFLQQFLFFRLDKRKSTWKETITFAESSVF